MSLKIKRLTLPVVACILLYSTSCTKKYDPLLGNDIPAAFFTFTGSGAPAPATIQFINSSTGAVSYSWNFGDDSTSATANPAHIYTAAGSYTVSLTAINGANTNVFRATVIVKAGGVVNPVGGSLAPYLCSGKNGENAYFPLAVGDLWHYGHNNSTIVKPDDTLKVAGTQVIGANTYFITPYINNVTGVIDTRYYRVSGAGDIFQNIGGTDYLYLPANPTAGMSIGIGPTFEDTTFNRVVKSVTGTITTGNCTYTNCVVVELSQGGTVITDEYYVKGLGFIYNVDYQLNGALLK